MRIIIDPNVCDETNSLLTLDRVVYEMNKTFKLRTLTDENEEYILIEGWVKKY